MTTTEVHAASATETEAGSVGSFSGEWQSEASQAWHAWESDKELIGNVVAGGRGMPVIRFFDFFTGRSVGFAGAVKLYEHELVRVYAQNPVGRDPYLSRFANFDVIYVQYSGESTIETEYGPLELTPFHAAVVPAGVAHRTDADRDTRRLAIFSRAPIEVASPDLKKTDRSFVVEAQGGIDWEGVPPLLDPVLEAEGKELEATWLWDDPVNSPLWMERRKGALSGGTTGGRAPQVVGVFDFMAPPDAATKRGTSPGPHYFKNPNMQMRSYNLEGRQHGFDMRGGGTDELWLQFRGGCMNDTACGEIPLAPGECTIAYPGVAHRINGWDGFLRMNLYSEKALRLCVDPHQMVTHTTFTVKETTK